MDLILDILIPRDGVCKLNIEEILLEWGGRVFSRNPKRYTFKSSIVFEEYENMDYYERIIGFNISPCNFIALTLKGESLSDLEYIVNNNKLFKHKDNELLEFFNELYESLDLFCIILLLDEENIDKKYSIAESKMAIDVFLKSLNWESPQGIIITKGF